VSDFIIKIQIYIGHKNCSRLLLLYPSKVINYLQLLVLDEKVDVYKVRSKVFTILGRSLSPVETLTMKKKVDVYPVESRCLSNSSIL